MRADLSANEYAHGGLSAGNRYHGLHDVFLFVREKQELGRGVIAPAKWFSPTRIFAQSGHLQPAFLLKHTAQLHAR